MCKLAQAIEIAEAYARSPTIEYWQRIAAPLHAL